MARSTVINDTGMIKHRVCKGAGDVTDTAVLCGRDVAVILLGHCARSIITMTFFTVINPASMIKASVGESAASSTAASAMTYPAILSRSRMRGRRIRRLS